MKKIKLSQGKFALVDDEDFNWLNCYKWWLSKTKWANYAVRQKVINGKIKTYYMHREIIERYKELKNNQVDHINHNGLDNRKLNLRIVTNAQNQMNRIFVKNSSGYKGVSFHKPTGKWQASGKLNQKSKCLGYFNTREKAAIAYNNFAKENFGKYAYLNQIGGNFG